MSLRSRLTAFVVATLAAFVYIGNGIPQIKSAPVTAVALVAETPGELATAGQQIFTSDRAQCLTCHSLGEDPKARCPDLAGVGERAGTRKAGFTAAQYFIEAVYNPNAYVVQGFPRNQMTPVNRPPIALSHPEILAVLAYLNTLGGTTDEAFLHALKQAQEPWRRGLLKPDEGVREEERLPVLAGDPGRGRQLFEQHGCLKCHRVGSEGADVCPDLTAIGAAQRPEYIVQSIIEPSAVIVKGYKQVIVIWQDEDRMDVRGAPVAWLPSKEHPTRLRLNVEIEGGERAERELDLSPAAYVGDTVVGVAEGENFEVVCGEYVDGDEKQGVTLAILKAGRWVKRTITAPTIEYLNAPMSPMPANFAELMTPRDVYDLVAYLLTQKGM